MDGVAIKLFNNDATTVAMPSIPNDQADEQATLISEDIQQDISGEKVKILRIKEEVEIEPENFILDLSAIEQITASQKEVIKSIVDKHGTVAIYLYKKQGLIKLGYGEKYSLERMLPIIRKFVFEDEIKVYKDFSVGGKLIEIDGKDITKLRIHL